MSLELSRATFEPYLLPLIGEKITNCVSLRFRDEHPGIYEVIETMGHDLVIKDILYPETVEFAKMHPFASTVGGDTFVHRHGVQDHGTRRGHMLDLVFSGFYICSFLPKELIGTLGVAANKHPDYYDTIVVRDAGKWELDDADRYLVAQNDGSYRPVKSNDRQFYPVKVVFQSIHY